MQRPAIHPIKDLKMLRPSRVVLSNGIPVYVIQFGDDQVSRINILTEGGKCDSNNAFTAELMIAALREGSKDMDAGRIAERLDFYGAWLAADAATHNTTLTLHTLNRNFDQVLSILAGIVQNPVFPAHEIGNLKSLAINRLRANKEKVSYLALQQFGNLYFGPNHNLGAAISEQIIDGVSTTQLQNFHSQWFAPENIRIIVAGSVSDEMIHMLDQKFGSMKHGVGRQSASDCPDVEFCPQTAFIEKADALQNAIRIGIPAIARTDPDYIPLRILTTALGGYFGSRLMTNIRETKGYTYGISASLLGYRNNSVISISSQCDSSYTAAVVEEIKKEMAELCQNTIPHDELRRIRSYMLSDLARSLDTPFSVADDYVSMLNNRIPEKYFDRQIDIINAITPERLRDVARRYYDTSNMLIVVAGRETT